MKAIVLHSVVPVRAEARETAAMETELLFGETCNILEQQSQWWRIQNDADQEEGWVDRKMVTPMSEQEWAQVQAANKDAMVKLPVTFALSVNNGQTIPLTGGTRLMNYQDGKFEVLGAPFQILTDVVTPDTLEMTQEKLMEVVRFYLNTPYRWGGKSALGMDCSGFTQVIHSLFGHALPRNASAQARVGRQVSRVESQAGDLAFFDHEDGRISHVGMVLDKEKMIHCSGRVKVEKWDENGIWNLEEGKYSHHLVEVRRMGDRL